MTFSVKSTTAGSIVFLLLFLCSLTVFADEKKVTAAEWMERGREYWQAKNFVQAIWAYDHAIEMEDDNRQALLERGKLYIITQQFDGAVSDFSRCIELEPEDADLYWLRGLAYAGKGNHLAAVAAYNKTLRLNPNMLMAYWNAALSYERLGAPNYAIQEYTRFVELASPDFPNVQQAQKRLAELVAWDEGRITANAANNENISKRNYVLDFFKTDYVVLAFGKNGWRVGFSKASNNMQLMEFTKGEETVANWTELVTVQFDAKLMNISAAQYAEFIARHNLENYEDKTKVQIIRTSPNDALVEYSVSGQPGLNDEHTITRIIKGKTSLILLNYAVKPKMTIEQRREGLAILENVKYW